MRQRVFIEEGRALIDYYWPCGVKLHIESFIPPKPNVLVVRWKAENWNATTAMGKKPPVWFSLYRWADPTIQAFAARQLAASRHDYATGAYNIPKITPLPPPATKQIQNLWAVEQAFPEDITFKNGFRYLLVPFLEKASIAPVEMKAVQEARLHVMPGCLPNVQPFLSGTEGSLVIAVATTSDAGGPEAEVQRVQEVLSKQPQQTVVRWVDENRQSAKEFWGRSKLSIGDPLLENLWYQTYHARRCAYRRGTVPPGLFLPSTVQDYSHWHGDYHWNYNFQEPFWGDYVANHLELGDAYFDGFAFGIPMGRKIAKDYYGCRGLFVQLSTYPIPTDEDILGAVPMGRMAYVTGWAANQFWWRYCYTHDKEWLRTNGYPILRDCALFYADFLKKREDGRYHAFPSNQGEDGFTGNPKDYTDRPQVMQHLRYCLRSAILAAETLDVDKDLQALWRDRLEHAAGDDGKPPLVLSGLEKECHDANPPEFGFGRPYRPQPEQFEARPLPERGWYFGQYPIGVLGSLRGGDFVADRDLPAFRYMVEAWRHPNGLVWAMSLADYGRSGAWTESLGVCAPLQEMMLQSWDGALRIFPAWPKKLDARFENFRAEGAFLVSADWSQGRVASLAIHSEKGGPCKVYSPWPKGFQVTDRAGSPIAVTSDPFGRPTFSTQPGKVYRLRAKEN